MTKWTLDPTELDRRLFKDFRSALNSNGRENSESTIETMGLVSSQVSKKIDELKRGLNTQIVDTIKSIFIEKVLPNIQITMTSQNPSFREEADHRSSRLSRTAEEKRARKACKKNSKHNLVNSSRHDYFRGNSDVSQASDEDHDMVTGANLTPRTVPEFLTGRPMHSLAHTESKSPTRSIFREYPFVPRDQCQSLTTTQTPSDALRTC